MQRQREEKERKKERKEERKKKKKKKRKRGISDSGSEYKLVRTSVLRFDWCAQLRLAIYS